MFIIIQGFKKICFIRQIAALAEYSNYSTFLNNNKHKHDWKKRRNFIFDNEIIKRKTALARIEKIKVTYNPLDKDDQKIELNMNKNLSTPSDVAQHLSKELYKASALALVNDEPWDMNKPLDSDCTIKLLSMNLPTNSIFLNPAFWRTSSLILGSMIESAFKDEIQVYLYSFPRPNVRSGSFVYDVILDSPNWKPSDAELRALSAQYVKIINKEFPVECLQVKEEVALDMFQDNLFKTKQIPEIAKLSKLNLINLYRIGDFIDISKGPMVGNTNIIGRAMIAAVHKIESDETDCMYRFQGVAIPRGIFLNHFAFGILENKAKMLNETIWMPQKMELENVISVKTMKEKSAVIS